MSLINKEVSNFKVNAYLSNNKEEFKEITKQDILGKWSIFFFYPADFSFVCPTELEDLALIYEEFQKENAEVYAISTDSEFVHKAWHDTSSKIKKIKYPMLSDSNHNLSIDFDVLSLDDGFAERGSFIINPLGRIVFYEISSSNVARSASHLLKNLRASKFVYENNDLVCPAKWAPGEDGLKPGLDLVGKL